MGGYSYPASQVCHTFKSLLPSCSTPYVLFPFSSANNARSSVLYRPNLMCPYPHARVKITRCFVNCYQPDGAQFERATMTLKQIVDHGYLPSEVAIFKRDFTAALQFKSHLSKLLFQHELSALMNFFILFYSTRKASISLLNVYLITTTATNLLRRIIYTWPGNENPRRTNLCLLCQTFLRPAKIQN